MKNIIAAVFLAITSIGALGQTIDQAALALQQRQQASAGASAAQEAYNKGSLLGVAELSSACLNEAKTGQRNSDYCLGIEAVGLTMRDKTPNADARSKGWFDHPAMTDRVLVHCASYLGLKGESACGYRLAAAKSAIPARETAQSTAPQAIAKPASAAQGEILINGRGQVLTSGNPNKKELRCVHNLVDKEKAFADGWEDKILNFCKK